MNPQTRRAFLTQLAALPMALHAHEVVEDELELFDKLMTKFVEKHKVPGASLTIGRHGRILFDRGFGLSDREARVKMAAESRFRIASVSKPITAAAILQLAEKKKLTLDDKVLDHVKLKPHLLEGRKVDARWTRITLRHLLHHAGGWDRDKSYDPITITPKIADALQCGYPVKPEQVCRYMMGQPLDFEPGERYAYSNLGYLLLGRVIEAVTGTVYEEWVKKNTLAPLGIRGMQLGRARLEDRAKNEVRYYDSKGRRGPALYGEKIGEPVPMPYGGQNLEAYEAHGGWIASGTDLVRFASTFDDPARCPIMSRESLEELAKRPSHAKSAAATFYGCGWNVRPDKPTPTLWHSGLIGGTSALLVHRSDGLNWGGAFQHRPQSRREDALECDRPIAAGRRGEYFEVGVGKWVVDRNRLELLAALEDHSFNCTSRSLRGRRCWTRIQTRCASKSVPSTGCRVFAIGTLGFVGETRFG